MSTFKADHDIANSEVQHQPHPWVTLYHDSCSLLDYFLRLVKKSRQSETRGADLGRCSQVLGLVAPPLLAALVVPPGIRLWGCLLHPTLHLHPIPHPITAAAASTWSLFCTSLRLDRCTMQRGHSLKHRVLRTLPQGSCAVSTNIPEHEHKVNASGARCTKLQASS